MRHLQRLSKAEAERKRREGGFTLIELLVVIIIIAILAAIAIPTYLGQRQKAQDSEAVTLVGIALTAVQTGFVDTSDYTQIALAELTALEPSMNWVQTAADLVTATPVGIVDPVGADARLSQVAFYPQSPTVVDLACVSASGNSFGVQIDTVNLAQTKYIKVKIIDGTADLGW